MRGACSSSGGRGYSGPATGAPEAEATPAEAGGPREVIHVLLRRGDVSRHTAGTPPPLGETGKDKSCGVYA